MTARSTTPLKPLSLTVRSDPAQIHGVRHVVEDFAQQNGVSVELSEAVGLCLNEAMANVIRHAYAGKRDRPIQITVEIIPPGGMRVLVRDWGNGVDPQTIPRKPHDPMEPGGVGLVCLKELMDEVVFTPQPDGMLLTLVKRGGSGEVGPKP